MTGERRTPVTVVGLGAMGSALAGAFVDAGHPTTVWNRTAARAAPLTARGAVHTESVEDAVAASPLVVTCLTTYDATREVLGPAAGALRGRALATLNSGSPAGARRMASWAADQGARYLDGAVKNVPSAVGAPDTVLCYGGDRAVFDEHEATLRVLGGATVHLGDEADLAALYETAVGGTLLPTLVGFLQGAALLQTRGLEARTLVPFTVSWLEMIGALLPTVAQEIDSGDHTRLGPPIGHYVAAVADDEDSARLAGLDVAWHAPYRDLLSRAVATGHGEHSISALVELLKTPEQAA